MFQNGEDASPTNIANAQLERREGVPSGHHLEARGPERALEGRAVVSGYSGGWGFPAGYRKENVFWALLLLSILACFTQGKGKRENGGRHKMDIREN